MAHSSGDEAQYGRKEGKPQRRIDGLRESGNPKPGFPLSLSPDSLRRKENRIQEKSVNPKAVYTKLLTPPPRLHQRLGSQPPPRAVPFGRDRAYVLAFSSRLPYGRRRTPKCSAWFDFFSCRCSKLFQYL